jgi:hypothetical protein
VSFHDDKPGPSNRRFGLVIGAILAAFGAFPLVHDREPHVPLLAIGAALVVTGLVLPRALAWPKRGWMALGAVLGRVTNPILLGLLYFVVVTPFAFVVRMFGAEPLTLAVDKTRATYWSPREQRRIDPDTLKRPF